ncbi:MAG: glycoside hydrolase family 2 TIM barrel-domain containing protein [Agriterribacter sp.]
MIKSIRSFFLLAIMLIGVSTTQSQSINLAGEWRFRLDSANKGLDERWFDKVLAYTITLPASCEEKGFGVQSTVKDPHRLTRAVRYEGKAWYQRTITIPPSWKEKRIALFLERCHWVSSVWIDGLPLGAQNSLIAPHVYETGSLLPGEHTITICIDNTYGAIPIGTWGFAITDDTQGNWNGIIGRMELQATDPVWIRSVQVYPDHLQVSVGNATGASQQVVVQGKNLVIPITGTVTDLPFTPAPGAWDEFSAAMHTVKVTLQSKKYSDTQTVSYGIRKLTTSKGQFIVNGHAVLMRGPVNECVYPATGHPPMDKAAWLRVLRICKSYGFNFMRFNSWCPPEAAFQAADETGIYLQVELPFWSIDAPVFGEHPLRDQFLFDELQRILTTYGNHPSFAFMAMGNESPGPFEALVHAGKKTDNRMLYRCQNGDTITNGDYAERGTEIGQRGVKGPRTDWDRWSLFSSNTIDHYKQSPLPTFAHEVGQWSSYPDFDQLKKFTGNLKPYNYERFQQSLADHHMASQEKDFAMASGKFAVSLYKDEIEGCLRTFPYGGFQIVEARDFTGEGAAIIGWLDAFWDSKGLIEPDAFRRFCAPLVCLLRMPKRVYMNDEAFIADALVSNYSTAAMSLPAGWSIADEKGNIKASGTFPGKKITAGGVTSLGNISTSLQSVNEATRLVVTISAAGTSNSWNIWVYPTKQPEAPANVKVVYAFDEATKAALQNGENVLLFSDPAKGLNTIQSAFLPADSLRLFPPVTKGKSAIPGSFMPAFWNMRLFNQPGTLSILCDPHHPALQFFTTEPQSDWQWADLLGQYTAQASYAIAGDNEAYEWNDKINRSKSIILNETPANYKPIVQVIDNYERNYKLGIIFETKVGKGKLLICALDLDTDAEHRPAARQLKSSLLQYASGEAFNPAFELPVEWLERVLTF